MTRILFLLTIHLFLFSGCRSKLSEEQLVQYITDPDNGLIKTKEVGIVKYELKYRPTDLIVWQDFKNRQDVPDSLVEQSKKQYDQYYYFILTISAGGEDLVHGGVSGDAFSENLNKLSFRMGEYASLIADKDTIPLADFYFPRFYGMTKSTQVMLAFEREKKEAKELRVNIDDIGIGTGNQSFVFKKKDIEKVPALDYEKN